MSSFKRHLCYLIMTFIKMISRDSDRSLLWHVASFSSAAHKWQFELYFWELFGDDGAY